MLASIVDIGCRDSSKLKLEEAPTGLVVSVVLSADGKIQKITTKLSDQSLDNIRLDADGALVSWVIPSTVLLSEKGEVLNRDALASLTLRSHEDDAPSGSCSRCVTPSNDGIQVLRPGDACAIPAGAKRHVSESGKELVFDLETIRRSVIIDRPGPCECEKSETAIAAPMTYVPYSLPGQNAWPYSAYALAPDGTLGVFSEIYAQIRLPDGTSRNLKAKGLPFRGPVIGASAVSDGFIVISQFPELLRPHEMYHVNWDLTQFQRVWTNEESRRRIQKVYQGHRPDQVFMAAHDSRLHIPQLLDCTKNSSNTYDCASVLEPIQDQFKLSQIVDIYKTVDDKYAVLFSDGRIAVGEMNNESWAWNILENPAIFARDGKSYRFGTAKKIIQHANHWVLCGLVTDTQSNDESLTVFTAPKDTNALNWTPIQFEEGDCYGMWPKKSDPSVLLVELTDDQTWELTSDLVWSQSSQTVSQQEGINHPIARVDRPTSDQIVFISADQSLFYRPKNSNSTADQLYGGLTQIPHDFTSVLAFDAHILAIRADGETAKIHVDQPQIEYTSIIGLLPGETIVDAHRSSHEDKILLVTTSSFARILQVNPQSLQIETELFSDKENPKAGRKFHKVVDTDRGHIFVTSDEGEILHVKDAKATPVNIEWDDPSTIVKESRLENLRKCIHDGRRIWPSGSWFRLSPGIWQDLTHKQGIVWAAGCESALVRIVTQGDQFFAQRFDTVFESSSLGEIITRDFPPALSTGFALCGDHVYTGSHGADQVTDHRGRVWQAEFELQDSMQYTSAYKPLPSFDALDAPEQHLFRINFGFPVALLGPPEHFRFVFNAASHRRSFIGDLSGKRSLIIDDDATSAAQIGDRLVVIGFRFGRLFIGRPTE
jgi:hypothetical protein